MSEAPEVVLTFCLPHFKGMRVDQTKVLNKPKELQDGEYGVPSNGRAYRVKIVLDAIFITRTK